MVGKTVLDDGVLDDLATLISWDALDLDEEPEVLLDRHCREDNVVLWAVSDALSSLAKA